MRTSLSSGAKKKEEKGESTMSFKEEIFKPVQQETSSGSIPVPVPVPARTGSSSSSAMKSSINSNHALDPGVHASQDGLSNTNSAEELWNQLKAKEMYLQARRAELDRQEDNMRIRQEMRASKELQHRQVGMASLISDKESS